MPKQYSYFALILVTGTLLSCQAQQEQIDPLDSFIKTKGDSLYKAEKVPGIFIGLLNNGQRKYYNFGYADPGKKEPFDSTTLFEIGSITKTFTAYVLEKVLRENSISDSSLIIKYLPDSVRQNKTLGNITFLNLVNHTSGLPRLPDNLDLASKQPYENYDTQKLFAYLKTCTPQTTGQYIYSNLAFGLAGVLASAISGKSYTDLVDQYIFFPWQIRKTGETQAAVKKSKGFFEKEPVEYWKFDALAGAGVLTCSASELLTYFRYVSAPSSIEAKQVIEKLLEPTFTITPGTSVCRAWHTIEEKGRPVIYWHNGGTYGFSCFGAFVKEKNTAVIVVVNQFNKNLVSDGLGREIMNKLIAN